MILFCLSIILGAYLLISLILFLSFVFGKFAVTITNTTTNEKQQITGFKKIKYFLFMAICWPITIHFNK